MNKTRLLVVEDDPQMQRLLQTQLAARGFQVQVVDNGPDAVAAMADVEPSVLLLDIGLPGPDGLEVCRQIREWSAVPIILVTAADLPQTKIKALDMGADDYLTKPFHVGELVARIRAVLRRSAGSASAQPSVLETGDLRIDFPARRVWRGGEEAHLTRMEFDLLSELARHPDRVLTHQHLLDTVWEPGYEDVRSVHVQVCNLRRKLERGPTGPRRILAVPGVGYRFRMNE
jgi:two-component system KDP operon response regulator KdpE